MRFCSVEIRPLRAETGQRAMALHRWRTQGDVFGYVRSPLLVLRERQYSGHRGTSRLCQQVTFHFGRLAQPRRGVNFLQSLVSGVPPQH